MYAQFFNLNHILNRSKSQDFFPERITFTKVIKLILK